MFYYLTFASLLACTGSLVWNILGSATVARSPFRIVLVGLLTCVSGFFIQTQIHRTEGLPIWLIEKIPMFAADREVLGAFNKLVEVVVYASGGGIIGSALFLRAQQSFEREQKSQVEILRHANQAIAELERDLKFVEADAFIHGIADIEGRRKAILRMIVRYEQKRSKADKILHR